MEFTEFLEKDITVHTPYKMFRGVLKEVHHDKGVLEFAVGYDILYLNPENIYAITYHGLQREVEEIDSPIHGD